MALRHSGFQRLGGFRLWDAGADGHAVSEGCKPVPRRGPLRIGVQGEEPELSASHANARANPRLQAQKTLPASKTRATRLAPPTHPPTDLASLEPAGGACKMCKPELSRHMRFGQAVPQAKTQRPLLDTARFFFQPRATQDCTSCGSTCR